MNTAKLIEQIAKGANISKAAARRALFSFMDTTGEVPEQVESVEVMTIHKSLTKQQREGHGNSAAQTEKTVRRR